MRTRRIPTIYVAVSPSRGIRDSDNDAVARLRFGDRLNTVPEGPLKVARQFTGGKAALNDTLCLRHN